jgi:hypothetical protein
MQQVAVVCSSGDAQYVLETATCRSAHGKRLYLQVQSVFASLPCQKLTYHFQRSVAEIDKGGNNFAIFTSSIQSRSIPQRQNRANKLGKAFSPCSFRTGPPARVQIVKLQKVAFLIELIAMAVQVTEYGGQLWRRVLRNVHLLRLICLHHALRSVCCPTVCSCS